MSWKATAYVKDLQQAPNGQKITCSEKLIMFVLADCYNEDYHQAWPSVQRLATASLMTERHARRILLSLEDKGLIQIVRRQGSGNTNTYCFPGYPSEVTKEKPDMMSGLPNSKTGQAKYRNRTLGNPKPDTAMSAKPRVTETQAENLEQEERNYYLGELEGMKREDPIGEFNRKTYRARLDDPTEPASFPEWFRRQAEEVFKSARGTSSSHKSSGAQRKK
jgi:Helix-turn-helix domain